MAKHRGPAAGRFAVKSRRGRKVRDVRENTGAPVVDKTDALAELGDLLIKTGRELRRLAYRDDLSEDERVDVIVAAILRLRAVCFPEEMIDDEPEPDTVVDRRGT